MVPSAEPPAPPLQAWPDLEGLVARRLAGGLINDTWAVGDPPVAVVQRLHPVFSPEVHHDIEAVTRHLARRGLPTPRLLRTRAGGLWHLDPDGRCWRALSWVPGRTIHRLDDPDLAWEAGALVGRFHAALADLDHRFRAARTGVHDTAAHVAALRAALRRHADHRLHPQVAELAARVVPALEALRPWDGLPVRTCHGDLKISNLRFRDGRAVALVDLDTVGPMALDAELGDALRSWCNPAGEDAPPRFSPELYRAAVDGYAASGLLDARARALLPRAVERIALELATRFARDALEERYFGWDPAVAPTRGEHCLLRARGQAALARQVRAAAPGLVGGGPDGIRGAPRRTG